MALSRLLLLCMVASEVWIVWTKPTDFVCNRAARRAMNIVPAMDSALSDCDSSKTLVTAVQLPCTELHVASWEKKSDQEKRGDVVASLRVLSESVKAVAPRQAGCGALILQRLENNINNYVLILTRLQLSQGPVVTSSLSCVPRSTQSLKTVLLSYNQLISGKLERFMVNLEGRCPSQ